MAESTEEVLESFRRQVVALMGATGWDAWVGIPKAAEAVLEGVMVVLRTAEGVLAIGLRVQAPDQEEWRFRRARLLREVARRAAEMADEET